MMIRLEIEAESLSEYFETLRILSTNGVVKAETVAAEPVENKKRGGKSNVVELSSAKKSEPAKVIEHEAAKVETTNDDEPELPLDDEAADLADKLEDPVEPETPKLELTLDLVRKYAVKYVNDVAVSQKPEDEKDQQYKARVVFQALLAAYKVTKFTEISVDKLADVHAHIVKQRKGLGLADLDIATLA